MSLPVCPSTSMDYKIIRIKAILSELNSKSSYSPHYLIDFVDAFRPKTDVEFQQVDLLFHQFVQCFSMHSDYAHSFREYLNKVFHKKKVLRSITESGIITNDSFTTQLRRLLISKVFLAHYPRNDLLSVLEKLFPKANDYDWVKRLNNKDIALFFQALGLRETHQIEEDHPARRQLLQALKIISIRISALGLVNEVTERIPELETLESPFVVLPEEVNLFIAKMEKAPFLTQSDPDFKHIFVLLEQCKRYISIIRSRKKSFGINLVLTNYLLRLKQNIKRAEVILNIVAKNENPVEAYHSEIEFCKNLIKAQSEKRNLSHFIKTYLELIAFQISEHTSSTGENYITKNTKEYWKMLMSSAGAGIIVGFLSVFKNIIYYMHLPLFGSAFMYSLNYSMGFILIYMSKTKLATKQPAMTASCLAQHLDIGLKKKTRHLFENEAYLVRQIFRSQFIAFVGNLLFAFPVAYLIANTYTYYSGSNPMDQNKALQMVQDIHPFKSPSLLYASLTGVYLYIAGVISGYYDNFNINYQFSKRLKYQKWLRGCLGPRNAVRISNYSNRHFGAIMGNAYLGLFLGCTSTLGEIIGIPLDIRHITFASGNFGMAFQTIGNQLSHIQIIESFVGIILIGTMNFVFSFGLAIITAIKSRKLQVKRTGTLLYFTLRLFLHNPVAFFIPVKLDKKMF